MKRILPGKPLPVRPAPRDLCRFLAKLVVGDVIPEGLDDPCWLWQGGTDKHGYGYFWFEGKCRWAHRYAFEAVKGPITRGEEIDHLCHNHGCCNWNHLEAKDALVNRGRRRKANGHALEAAAF